MQYLFDLPVAIRSGGTPDIFPSPFSDQPHPLARNAARLLQTWLEANPDQVGEEGKMFAVLVVESAAGKKGYLRGFSGMLMGAWRVEGFVPPIFDAAARDSFLAEGGQQLDALTVKIETLKCCPDCLSLQQQLLAARRKSAAKIAACEKKQAKNRAERKAQRLICAGMENEGERRKLLNRLSWASQQDKRERKKLRAGLRETIAGLENRLAVFEARIDALQAQRKVLSQSLHRRVFEAYQLENMLGETSLLTEFFHTALPPGGAGDCAGPKLIHHAIRRGLRPVAMAEFWWGPPPAGGGRHHGQFYPSCRGKCKPILPFMLRGIPQEPHPLPFLIPADDALNIIYEDDYLLLVNKPHGLLSTPGIDVGDSVYRRLKRRLPKASGPLLVHRLDLATSGLLLAAKTAAIHKQLQKQFMDRSIRKRYIAVLEGNLSADRGEVSLPLRVDLDDRPRQIVCHRWGKPALTRWEIISRKRGRTRVHFFPVTGRTHQLRVHAASQYGLNAPIVGDALYGRSDERLMLHAAALTFTHPVTGQTMHCVAEPDF